eukprot:8668298-Pyramimonas_sp.AAC.1
MQLRVAQGAALSSNTARRGVDWVEGPCGASARSSLWGAIRVKGVAAARARPLRPSVELLVECDPR